MKTKFTILSLALFAVTAFNASAQDRLATPGGSAVDADCNPTKCTIERAIEVASPGDAIILDPGTYSEGGLIIDKDFLTIRPDVSGNEGLHPDGGDGARGAEAIIQPPLLTEYAFAIQAHNVTIHGLEIDLATLPSDDAWTGILIMEGGWDRWTIEHNIIHGTTDQKDPAGDGVSNFSYGIYGDAQTASGSDTMTGGMIRGNYIHTLGFGGSGSNVSSGVGIYLEGIEGEDADCNFVDRFDCGVWIFDNHFEHLYTGKSLVLQGVTTPGGKEYSYATFIAQDEDNILPNNGAWVGGNANTGADPKLVDPVKAENPPDNVYDDDNIVAHGTGGTAVDLEVGVRIAIGGSTVNEDNTALAGDVVQYVINDGRKATISELILADFYKTLFPRVFGEGTDVYTETEAQALELSDDSATIVFVEEDGADVNLHVKPYGESVSYKVSIDNDGDFNLRSGARLLFDAPLANGSDGVDQVTLYGTSGDDLLTVDFNNGNPIPTKTVPGLHFNPDDATFNGGFDSMAIRGDEQLDYQTIVMDNPSSPEADYSGTIYFEPDAPTGDEAPIAVSAGTTGVLKFEGLEPIDDVVIVNLKYSVVAPDALDNEINVINGPFRYGFDTFQINAGADKTFEEINFANKKHVHIHGADDTAGLEPGDDVFTVFTEDGDAPDLLLSLHLWGGDNFDGVSGDLDDDSDDYFVVRPSQDFEIYVDGGIDTDGAGGVNGTDNDYLFLDCANTDDTCQPGLLTADLVTASPSVAGDTGASITGFETVYYTGVEGTADDLAGFDIVIKKELVGFAANGAHPGDDLQYRVTLYNNSGADLDLSTPTVDSLWVTDAIDHRLSLIEQSVITENGTVDITNNRTMLWLLEGFNFADEDSISMTYDVIVNTLITTDDISNYASILNPDDEDEQNLSLTFTTGGPYYEHYASVDLDVLEVFGWPLKAAINSALFYETEAGPRYIVGLNGGAKDPTMFGMGALLCRVPDTNQAVGWDGGLGNLWYSCGEGLPTNGGIPEPLIVTDLYQDSAGRIWLTTWGHSGLFYSDDGAQTWTDALIDLGGAMGGGPDGNPDGFAQIYAITEDILGTLFISANNGDVYRSFDRGVTWQRAKQLPQGSATTAFSLEADPTQPGTLYAGTFGDSLYVTTDFAETWARPDGDGLGSGYIFDIEIDPQSGNLFVGTAQGIYYSPNGGDDWSGLNSAFPVPELAPEVRNIAFDANGAFFASTWGQGVWYSADWQATSLSNYALKTSNIFNMTVSDNMVNVFTDTGEVFSFAYDFSASVDVEEPGSQLPTAYALEQNYPNPFNPTTAIAFSLPEAAQVSLTVYDVLGRRVATLVNGQMQAGQHSVQFQASSLPSGMYLYKLTTPGGSISQKMILLK